MQNGKHVILCVDDDPDVLETTKLILEKNGYVFASASSAEDALKAYASVKPDLVLVDLMMEEVDAGTTLVRDLKAKGAGVPIYMLSSVGEELNQNIDTTELGLAGVFQKPLKPDVLLKALAAKLKK